MQKILISLFIFTLFGVVGSFFYFKYESKEEKLNRIYDQIMTELNTQLHSRQMDALEIALVLGQNSALVNALENDDEDLGYDILSTITKKIELYTQKKIRSQVITADYLIFARSWDTVYAGMPLGDYRTDLDYFKTNSAPRTSIELGRRLGFKATVPIYQNKQLLGFVEVIDFFEPLTEFFREQGIDMYVLMEDQYFDIAIFMQENMVIDEYIVANTNYNANHLDTLKLINFKNLKANRIVFKKQRYVFYESMKNGEGKTIGAFVFVLPQKYLDYFNDPEDDISFLVNVTRSTLYKVERSKRYEQSNYLNFAPKELIALQKTISDEDNKEFEQAAYKTLENYSKDELIQLLLEKKVTKKIDGEIR